MRATLELGNCMESAIGPWGLDEAAFDRALEEARPALDRLRSDVAEGRPGFVRVPFDPDPAEEIAEYSAEVSGRFDTLVHIGIGGSALGPLALERALRRGDLRGARPRFLVLDNSDPEKALPALETVDLTRALVHVVTKSGGTSETMAIFAIVLERLLAAGGRDAVSRQVCVTTGPGSVLDRWARAHGVRAFHVPPPVGGRYSVFTPVGILPAALLGLDVASLLAGARDAVDPCLADGDSNPALRSAVLLHRMDIERGRRIHAHFVYAEALRETGAWYVQLGAESLGKATRTDGSPAGIGPTPLVAVGATDQHSQLQLYMEGPQDKVVIFWDVARRREDRAIPCPAGAEALMGALPGHTLGDLISAEKRGTEQALTEARRPNATILLPEADARSLGEVMTLLMFQTVYLGALYGVDPFDQPGVEASKKNTARLMAEKRGS